MMPVVVAAAVGCRMLLRLRMFLGAGLGAFLLGTALLPGLRLRALLRLRTSLGARLFCPLGLGLGPLMGLSALFRVLFCALFRALRGLRPSLHVLLGTLRGGALLGCSLLWALFYALLWLGALLGALRSRVLLSPGALCCAPGLRPVRLCAYTRRGAAGGLGCVGCRAGTLESAAIFYRAQAGCAG